MQRDLRRLKDRQFDILVVGGGISGAAIAWYKDVLHAYVGIRPLVTKSDDSSSTYKASRKHEIINHKKAEKVFGLISVLGGKYTTSRGLAEAAVDIAMKEADLPKNLCRTANTPISGGHVGKRLSTFTGDAIARYKNDYSSDLISHLIEYYGSNYEKLFEVLKKEKCLDKTIDDGIALLFKSKSKSTKTAPA